jgi:hypothetical protein
MPGPAVLFRIQNEYEKLSSRASRPRTSFEGKQVTNRVLLAASDNEYELMRPDLTYIDLLHHLSLHEPTQNIEFSE